MKKVVVCMDDNDFFVVSVVVCEGLNCVTNTKTVLASETKGKCAGNTPDTLILANRLRSDRILILPQGLHLIAEFFNLANQSQDWYSEQRPRLVVYITNKKSV